MNRELLTWYKSLLPEQLSGIQIRYKEAPVIGRLLHFLKKCTGDNFTTQAAVRSIYEEEYQKVPFEKLRNRFFKLRKELLSSDKQEQTYSTHQVQGASEEILFLELREKGRSKYADTALRGLKELAHLCRERNLFELYPQVLREWIYGLLLLNEHHKTKEVLDELEQANALQADWNQMYLFYRQAFYFHQEQTDSKRFKEILEKIKRLSRKHPAWPRFQLAHLYTRITFETVYSTHPPQITGKHIRQTEVLLAKYPDMPVFYYGMAHRTHTEFQLDHYRIMYNFNLGNFEEAYQSLKNNWSRIEKGLINRPLSENEYRNRIKLELGTGRIQDALNTVKALIHFQKSTGLQENIPVSYQEMALIYLYTYPNLVPAQPQVLLKYLDIRMKQEAQKGNAAGRNYAETLITKAAMLLITGKYTEALKLIQRPEAKTYYNTEMYALILELYKLPLSMKTLPSKEAEHSVRKYIRHAEHCLGTTPDPVFQHMIGFVIRIAQSFLSLPGKA